MGLLDGLIGGAVGAEMITAVNGLVARHGGLGAMLQQLQSQGLGNAVKSWVGPGENLPVSPAEVHQAFGPEIIGQLAAKLGMTPEQLSTKLSQVLPSMVDRMTPNGVVPPAPVSPQ